MGSQTVAVAVFGSSEPRPGDEAFDTACRIGELLARAGYTVVTGGYGGVMEGASRGAREAGGRTIGVSTEIFDPRAPNPYLSEVVRTRDLYERTRELVDRSDAFVVLPGKAGTLAELAWLWALERAGCLHERPVVLLGASWKPLVDLLERDKMLEPQQIRRTHLARTAEAAMSWLVARLDECPGRDA